MGILHPIILGPRLLSDVNSYSPSLLYTSFCIYGGGYNISYKEQMGKAGTVTHLGHIEILNVASSCPSCFMQISFPNP